MFYKKEKRDADFLALIERRQETLYRIAYSYVKNKDDALDVVQETVCKAYSHYGQLRNEAYRETWLTRIAINTSIDFIKKRKKSIPLENDAIVYQLEKAQRAEDIQGEVDDKMLLLQAIEGLNDREKAVVILKYFEDLKLKEIAEILEMPLNSVKSLLYRTLKKMRIELEEVLSDE
ncbi:sigma-70 family RNA polymerase sigma factor [Fusibacter sp. JL298sf-3]